MFGIGTTEVLVILAVALLVIGPTKLPDVARALGKGMAEFRRMSSDVKRSIDLETQLSEMDNDTSENQAEQTQGQHASAAEDDQTPSSDSEYGLVDETPQEHSKLKDKNQQTDLQAETDQDIASPRDASQKEQEKQG